MHITHFPLPPVRPAGTKGRILYPHDKRLLMHPRVAKLAAIIIPMDVGDKHPLPEEYRKIHRPHGTMRDDKERIMQAFCPGRVYRFSLINMTVERTA